MDQHPIPQDVTGFQFKLIGSMTVKQFGIIALGVVAAVILYYTPIKGVFGVLLKVIFIPLLGGSGAIVAFVPIDGRPIDVMAGNFIKSLFAPNQYVYRKSGRRFSFSTVAIAKAQPATGQSHNTPTQKLINERGHQLQKLLLTTAQDKIKNPLDAREAALLQALPAASPIANTPPATATGQGLPAEAPKQAPIPPAPNPAQAPPTPPPPNASAPQDAASSPIRTDPIEATPPRSDPAPIKLSPEILGEKEEQLKKQLESAKKEESGSKDPDALTIAHQKASDLEKQVQTIHEQKQQLEAELAHLKNQLSQSKADSPVETVASPKATLPTGVTPPSPKPAVAVVSPKAQPAHVRSIPKDQTKRMGLLVSDTPNVVVGMVKDARDNILPNILVEINDKDGNPVRAFKTNPLGQFASATPLTPGTYTIKLEDPKNQHKFDSIQITATDQIMLPIEIISYDKREELRKDLFN